VIEGREFETPSDGLLPHRKETSLRISPVSWISYRRENGRLSTYIRTLLVCVSTERCSSFLSCNQCINFWIEKMAIFPGTCPSKIKMILFIRFTHPHILGEMLRTDSRADPSKKYSWLLHNANISETSRRIRQYLSLQSCKNWHIRESVDSLLPANTGYVWHTCHENVSHVWWFRIPFWPDRELLIITISISVFELQPFDHIHTHSQPHVHTERKLFYCIRFPGLLYNACIWERVDKYAKI